MNSESAISATTRLSKGALFLGIDVGGTNVKLGLVNSTGTVHAKDTLPTPELGTPERVFDAAIAFADRELSVLGSDRFTLAGIGLAVPGVLDTQESVLREVVNLPGWRGKRLRQMLGDARDLPNAVVNDANSAAYAEHASRSLGNKSLALVTLGTGVGCGLVINGSPYGGDHGCAGELGHIAIRFGSNALPCTCGKRGHLEAYAGSKGVLAQLQSLAEAAKNSDITTLLSTGDITPRDIAERAQADCDLCAAVVDQTAEYLGQAIGQLAQVIDPDVVLLGGAMTFGGNQSKVGQRFLATVQNTINDTTLEQVGTNLTVEFASLGNDAGVIGAAIVAQQVITT
jgi:glucokinase